MFKNVISKSGHMIKRTNDKVNAEMSPKRLVLLLLFCLCVSLCVPVCQRGPLG